MKKALLLLTISLGIITLGCDVDRISTNLEGNPSEETAVKNQSVVFIAGFDEGDNLFYSNAKTHFQQQNAKVVEGLYSLEEIVAWLQLHHREKGYDEIHIVSHGNAWRGLSLKGKFEGERITLNNLKGMLEKNELPKISKGVTEETKIIFHSCGLGENVALLTLLKKVFSSEGQPQVYASPYFNVFGGRYSSHYLAQPYYTYYPTANSKGPIALATELKMSYPLETIDWLTALKTREETSAGIPYSYRFNIPVEWDISFDESTDIPQFEDAEALMDWIIDRDDMAAVLYELGIPIEKFRWSSKAKGNHLQIRGKTTVQCILRPIMNANDSTEYQPLIVENPTLYCRI